MALFSGSALLGVGLGPLVCGFIGEFSTWRWVFWLQVIVNFILVGLFMLLVPETRESILLSQERDRLNEWAERLENQGVLYFGFPETENTNNRRAQRVRWSVGEEQGETVNIKQLIATSLTRPFAMLCKEPIVLYISLWAAFSWSVLYIALAVVPLMFTDVYGFSSSQADAVFASACIGSVIATVVGIYQERYLNWKRPPRDRGNAAPERRLLFTCVECLLLPIGLFMFGWTANAEIHWIAPTIAIALATAGISSVYLSAINYLVDCYRSCASSALAAQSACRNIMGGISPLITTQLYTGLGYAPGSSMLGGIAVQLSIGPWILVRYGDWICARSGFAQALATKSS